MSKDISLRDYFAGQAMQGILGASAIVYYFNHGQSCGTLAAHAEDAYRMADAMLAARTATEPQSNNRPTDPDTSNSPTDTPSNRD